MGSTNEIPRGIIYGDKEKQTKQKLPPQVELLYHIQNTIKPCLVGRFREIMVKLRDPAKNDRFFAA